MEATKNKKLAERDVAKYKAKADRCAHHMGARKAAVPDVRRLLQAHFGDALTVP